MILVIPVVAALFFFVQRPLYGERDRLLRAYTMMGGAVFAATEGLSWMNALNRNALFSFWVLLAAALAACLIRRHEGFRIGGWPFGDWKVALVVPPAFILLATLVIALAAPPNNWDSMTYHMARVANWAAHASVAHYPTSVIRQLVLSPWAEYAILNAHLLAGGSDRWAMLVQWSAFAFCALAASMILRQLNYPIRAQYAGAMFVLTIPMAILQSTSTQNDLVASVWIAAFVYFAMRPQRDFFFAALALGLAVNTKGTAVLIVPAFAIGAWLVHARNTGWQKATGRFATIAVLALLINIPFFVRNINTFGSPDGDEALVRSANAQVHDPLHLLSSVVRQMSLHMGTPVGRISWGLERVIVRAHEAIGVDPSDPRTSYTPFHIIGPNNHEDVAANPIHFWLLAAACLVVLVKRKRNGTEGFVLQLFVALLIFSAVLKWQLYASRLQLPLFVLGGVVAAAGFHALFKSRRAHRVLVAVLFVTCLPWIFLNRHRPLVTVAWDPSGPANTPGTVRSVLVSWLPTKSVFAADRTSQMFINRPFLERPYRRAVSLASAAGCAQIGLVTKEDSWEYPLHVLAPSAARFRHVGVQNASRKIPDGTQPLCSIIVLDDPPAVGGATGFAVDGVRFARISRDTLIRVFTPESR